MPNAIKYNVSPQTLALKEGDFWIGTGDVSKGPTVNTDYWNGITPPVGGYTIYLGRVGQSPIAYVANNDTELISLTNRIGSQNFTTVAQCLSWYLTQPDKMVLNIDYPAIVTDGLVLNLDAGFAPSYPTTGTTWYNMGPNSLNATLTNGPSFQSGLIYFDGTDDQATIAGTSPALDITSQITMIAWVNPTTIGGSWQGIFLRQTVGDYELWMFGNKLRYGLRLNGTMYRDSGNISLTANTWYMLAWTYDGSTVRLYVNAVADSTFSRSGAISTSDGTIYIGYSGFASERFNGYIAACQLYNKALSASEILKNYNAQKSRFGL